MALRGGKCQLLSSINSAENEALLLLEAGFGLGLSITNAIATAHDGVLSLHDRQPHGLVVRMRLPVRQQSERPAALTRYGPGGGKPQAA